MSKPTQTLESGGAPQLHGPHGPSAGPERMVRTLSRMAVDALMLPPLDCMMRSAPPPTPADIGYTGWVTAEVRGGDRAYLADLSGRMDRVLGME